MYSFHYVLWAIQETFREYHFAIAAYLLFAHTLLAIHEGGHAVTGALVGVRSTGIRIGARPVIKTVVLGYKITVGWSPTSGHTTFVEEGNFPDTWQVLATYLGGPLSVVCAGPVLFLLFWHTHLQAASIFGTLFVFCGVYDLRKSCPDGKAARRLWKVLRAKEFKQTCRID